MVKYDPNMEVKEEVQEIKTEEGTIADPCVDLAAEQERVNLVKFLISKNEKLEADTLANHANLEEMRRKLVEMKNAMDNAETEKRTFQSRLIQQNSESDALRQHFAQETRFFREENFELKQKLQLEVQQKEAHSGRVYQWRTLLETKEVSQMAQQPATTTSTSTGSYLMPRHPFSIDTSNVEHQRQVQTINVSEKKSAKMLVILENGEQRLITFSPSKETCPVEELLDLVGIQVGADSNIECIDNPGSAVNYVVKVGNLASSRDIADLTEDAENYIRQQNAQ